MKLSRKLLALALTTALPLVAVSANAQEKTVVQETTTMSDGSKVVVTSTTDKDAAADSMAVKYTSYSFDANHNGMIDNDEVISYVTRYADTNNDGFIESSEFEDGSMKYFYNMMEGDDVAQAQAQTYTFWDKDGDKRLDATEIQSMVSNTGVYKKWDTNQDGTINNAEFSRGTFSAYDKNKDGMISMEEWAKVVM